MVADNVIELKPRGVMELFDQAIRLYRNNFIKFVGIIAVAQVPIQIIMMLLNLLVYQGSTTNASSSFAEQSAYLTSNSIITFVTYLFTLIFVSGLATAALTRAIMGSYLGEEVSIGGAYQNIKASWGKLLVALILVTLLMFLLMIWAIIPCVGWFTGLGMILFISMVVTPLIAPVIVVEGRGAKAGIRRAWEMARRRFWWLTGFFMLLSLFNLLVVHGPVQIVMMAIQSYVLQGATEANMASRIGLQTISTGLLTLILSLVYLPLASTCATLAYFDLRVRQEGFDLALMANQTEATPDQAVELARNAPAIPPGKLVNSTEIAYFALFSLMGFGLYVVLVGIVLMIRLLMGNPTF